MYGATMGKGRQLSYMEREIISVLKCMDNLEDGKKARHKYLIDDRR